MNINHLINGVGPNNFSLLNKWTIRVLVLTFNTLGQVVLDVAALRGATLADRAGVDALAVLAGLLGGALAAAPATHSCKY